MERMFSITATNRVRLESRILQVLDHHMVPIQSFSSMRLGDGTRITFRAALDDASALRTCDLLRRLKDVQSIDSFACHDAVCRTVALLRVRCDEDARLPLLQAASSMGAQVVAVRRDWLALQAIGSSEEIDALRTRLLSYGNVEAMSAASTGVRSDESSQALEKIGAQLAVTPEVRKKSVNRQPAPLYEISI